MDRDILVTGGGQSAPANRQSAFGWVSLLAGLGAVGMMAGVVAFHFHPSSVLLNALILASIALALRADDSPAALLGFALAAGAFLIELFLILMNAALHSP